VTERFIARGVPAATANKTVTGLKSYWEWLAKRGHLKGEQNPWAGQRVKGKERLRRETQRETGGQGKRPFTNAEVSTLLGGLDDRLLLDFCRVAALTGMRRDEIAFLRVKHLQAGVIKVPGTKTANALRDVPVHPDLIDLFAQRSAGKMADGFIFHELPDQRSKARGRGAPIAQAFTRKRRALGVDDTPAGARQSRVDLHSFRRWFIRQAIEAIEEGRGAGFTEWTIADVVGHSKEDGPLGMTMGRYPGKAPIKALRACVEAVRLPAPELARRKAA
jgi:integrase